MSVLLVKQRISVSEPQFGGTGVQRMRSSLARCKTHIRKFLPIALTVVTTEALPVRRNRPLLKSGSAKVRPTYIFGGNI